MFLSFMSIKQLNIDNLIQTFKFIAIEKKTFFTTKPESKTKIKS